MPKHRTPALQPLTALCETSAISCRQGRAALPKVAAEFKEGVLQVHLLKSPVAKTKAIEVKVA